MSNCLPTAIKSLKIYGKSTIKHTPTEEYPSPILCFGYHTKNFFDVKYYVENNLTFNKSGDDVSFTLTAASGTVVFTVYDCPGSKKTCVWYKDIIKSNGVTEAKITVKQYADKSNNVFSSLCNIFKNKNTVCTTPGNIEHAEITVKVVGAIGDSVTIKNLTWEEGKTPSSYEKFGYYARLRITGKNIISNKYVTADSHSNCTYTENENGVLKITGSASAQDGQDENSGSLYYKGDDLNGHVYLLSTKKYTLSFKTKITYKRSGNYEKIRIGIRKYESGNFGSWANFANSGVTDGSIDMIDCNYSNDFSTYVKTFSVMENGLYSIVIYNCTNDVEIKDIQIETNENSSPVYEKPYVKEYRIFMEDRLRSIGANIDEFNVTEYKISRKINPELEKKRTVLISQNSAGYIYSTPEESAAASATIVPFKGYNCFQFISNSQPYGYYLSLICESPNA